jgi:hypothetical protein
MEDVDNGKHIMAVELHLLFYVLEDVRIVIFTVATMAIGRIVASLLVHIKGDNHSFFYDHEISLIDCVTSHLTWLWHCAIDDLFFKIF